MATDVRGPAAAFQPAEPLPPPAASTGVVGWLRQNLFSSPLNTALTLLCLYLVYLVVPPLIRWAFVDATFTGTTPEACAGAEGACWAFVNARFNQFVFGFYPSGQRWRVLLAFGLLVVAFVPLFLERFQPKLAYAAGLVVLYPIAAYVLFYGGVLGLAEVPTTLWGGLFLTIVIAGVGIVSSLPLGILLALGRRSTMPVVRVLSVVFIEVVRGVPLITVLFMASVMLPLFLPTGVNFDKVLRALVGVALFSSAYMAENVRGGLQAIPKGQAEAASALGLGYWRTTGLIVMPQALRLVIPSIVNTFISLFKDTTLVSIIGLFDFLGSIQAGLSDARWLAMSLEGYAFCALGFWAFCFAMSRYSQRLEARLNAGRNR